MRENEYEYEIDILEFIQLFYSNIYKILMVTMLFVGAGFFVSKWMMTQYYEASVNMIVNTRMEGSTYVTNDNIISAENMVGTYAIIIKSNIVLNQLINDLDLDLEYEELEKLITVNSLNSTQVMEIKVKYPDSAMALKILDKLTEIAPDVIVDAVEAGSCKVISDIEVSADPVSPNIWNWTILSGLTGTILSYLAILVYKMNNTTIENDEDIQRYLNLPVLGVIPEVEL